MEKETKLVTKICTCCSRTFSIDMFRYGQCKDCVNKQVKERYHNDPEYRTKRLLQNKKSRDKNPEKGLAAALKWQKDNPEKANARNRKYQKSLKEKNPEQYKKQLLRNKKLCAKSRENLLPYYVEDQWRQKFKSKGLVPPPFTDEICEEQTALILANRNIREISKILKDV